MEKFHPFFLRHIPTLRSPVSSPFASPHRVRRKYKKETCHRHNNSRSLHEKKSGTVPIASQHSLLSNFTHRQNLVNQGYTEYRKYFYLCKETIKPNNF